MQLALLALLLVVVAVLIRRAVNRERQEYARFKRLRATAARQKVYRRWLIDAALVFGGLSAAVLLAAWAQVPLALASARGWDPVAGLLERLEGGLGTIVAIALGIAYLVGLILPAILLRGRIDELPAVGDVRALLPRTRGEVLYGAGMSINAGIVEELLFRLALPALLFGIIGDGPLSFLLAALLFGLLHLYQGPVGVVVTTVLGLVFAALYVVTGSILVPIVVHALFDLRSMVLLPVVIGGAWSTGRPRRPASEVHASV